MATSGSSSSSAPTPSPGEGELLIAPTAVGICGTDVEIFDGSLAYFRMGIASYPIVPGHEWTGTVVDVGSRRDRLRAGRPRRGRGRDRLRRVRALPRGPAAPVRAAHRDGHRPHGRRDGLADGLPGRVRAPRGASSRARRAGRADARSRCTPSGAGGWRASACWSSARGRSGCSSRSARAPRAPRRSSITDTREDRLTLAAALGFPPRGLRAVPRRRTQRWRRAPAPRPAAEPT